MASMTTKNVPRLSTVLVAAFVAGVVGWLAIPKFMKALVVDATTGVNYLAVLSIVMVVAAIVVVVLSWTSEGGAGAAFAAVLVVFAAVSAISNDFMYDSRGAWSESDDSMPEMAVRAPYEVAENVLKGRASENVKAAFDGQAAYLPGVNAFSGIFTKPGWLKPHALIVQTNLDTGKTVQCEFGEEGGKRADTLMVRSLRSDVWGDESFDLRFSGEDIYGFCGPSLDSDNQDLVPWIVAPATTRTGVLSTRPVPAGVAVYNGQTGDREFYRDVTDGRVEWDGQQLDLPGGNYPISLAGRGRESAVRSKGWWDHKVTKTAGWDVDDDKGSPNAGNPEDMLLRYAEGASDTAGANWAYTTLVTPRGDSDQIVAVGIVNARDVRAGFEEPTKVYPINNGVSASEMNGRIRTEVKDIGFAAGENTVWEVVPLDSDTLIATIGSDKSANVTVIGDLTDSGMTLDPSEGTAERDRPAPTSSPTVQPSEDLSDMSDSDLFDLGRAVFDEVERRDTSVPAE